MHALVALAPDGRAAAANPTSPSTWRLAPGSHLAAALRPRARATPVAVVGGSIDVDPATGSARLALRLGVAGGGALTGTATAAPAAVSGATVWIVTGALTIDGTSREVVLALRDHGTVSRRTTWWWLSGTGTVPRGGRERRHRFGAPVVADLLFRR